MVGIPILVTNNQLSSQVLYIEVTTTQKRVKQANSKLKQQHNEKGRINKDKNKFLKLRSEVKEQDVLRRNRYIH